MKRLLPKILSLLFFAGLIAVFCFAWARGTAELFFCLAGILGGFVLASVLHELGHISFARAVKFRVVYTKAFCLKLYEKNGKLRAALASPFSDDQTQTVPISSGNMKKRAALYTLGGLVFGGAYLLVVLAAGLVLQAVGSGKAYLFFGSLPYAAYLFFLNAFPLYLAGGKTDMLVYAGIQKGEAEESAMLSAMEIFGFLSEGKSFSEVDEKWFTSCPIVREDIPVYAVIADLKYRYYLETGDFDGAADSINRLAAASGYLTDGQTEEVAAELSYMHALAGDQERADEARKAAKGFLAENTLAACRIQAAYCALIGDGEGVQEYKQKAKENRLYERIAGKRKAEEILLSRIESNERGER